MRFCKVLVNPSSAAAAGILLVVVVIVRYEYLFSGQTRDSDYNVARIGHQTITIIKESLFKINIEEETKLAIAGVSSSNMIHMLGDRFSNCYTQIAYYWVS